LVLVGDNVVVGVLVDVCDATRVAVLVSVEDVGVDVSVEDVGVDVGTVSVDEDWTASVVEVLTVSKMAPLVGAGVR
jgi:hypothetical protein